MTVHSLVKYRTKCTGQHVIAPLTYPHNHRRKPDVRLALAKLRPRNREIRQTSSYCAFSFLMEYCWRLLVAVPGMKSYFDVTLFHFFSTNVNMQRLHRMTFSKNVAMLSNSFRWKGHHVEDDVWVTYTLFWSHRYLLRLVLVPRVMRTPSVIHP